MAQQVIQNNAELSRRIRQRRMKLDLTIEEAASRAGVGTKTWSRYESGGAIRKDKSKGICKALNWRTLSGEQEDSLSNFSIEEYKKHKSWSLSLEKSLGPWAAVSFVIGSDILLDNLSEDIDALASMPKGSHVGELDVSFLAPELPPQFLMDYDYGFLFLLRSRVTHFCNVAHHGGNIVAHSVLDELTLYLIMQESSFLMESMDLPDDDSAWKEWAFELFDDYDLLVLYSDESISTSHPYHFFRWAEEQFWLNEA